VAHGYTWVGVVDGLFDIAQAKAGCDEHGAGGIAVQSMAWDS